METRIALLAVLVKNQDSVEKLNALLHEYRAYIVGRMGIPYKQKQVAIISIAIDATQDIISALSGKIGALEGVSSKTVFAYNKKKLAKFSQRFYVRIMFD